MCAQITKFDQKATD